MNVELEMIIFHGFDALNIFIDNTHFADVLASSSLSSFPLSGCATRIIKTLTKFTFNQSCFDPVIVCLLHSIF